MAVAQGRKVSISLRVRDNDHGSPSNIWHRQWYSLPKKHPPTKRGRGGPFAARCTAAAHNKVKRPDGASVLPSGRPTRPDRALGIPPTDVCRAGHCQEWRPLLRFPSLRICGEISPSREMWDNGSVCVVRCGRGGGGSISTPGVVVVRIDKGDRRKRGGLFRSIGKEC